MLVSSEATMAETPSPGGLRNPSWQPTGCSGICPWESLALCVFYFELGPRFTLITHVAFLVFLLFDLLLIVLLDFRALLIRLVCCSVTGSPGGVGKERLCPVYVRRSADAVTVRTLMLTSGA